MPYAVSSKGRVTIPKVTREFLNLRANDRVEFVRDGDRVFLIRVKTLRDFRGSVPAIGEGNFVKRDCTKTSVARRDQFDALPLTIQPISCIRKS